MAPTTRPWATRIRMSRPDEGTTSCRIAPCRRNHLRLPTASSTRQSSRSFSQRKTSSPQLPKRGLRTRGGRMPSGASARGRCTVFGCGSGRRRDLSPYEACRASRASTAAVEDADTAAGQPCELIQPVLDPVERRKNVETKERRVERREQVDRVLRREESCRDTTLKPGRGKIQVRLLRAADDRDDCSVRALVVGAKSTDSQGQPHVVIVVTVAPGDIGSRADRPFGQVLSSENP